MLKSKLHLSEQLTQQLLAIPEIVKQFASKSPEAINVLLEWIDETENILTNNRMTQSAKLAGLKAKILAIELDPTMPRRQLKKQQQALATGLVFDLQNTVTEALDPIRNRIDEAKLLVRQLLQAISQSGAFRSKTIPDANALLREIWAMCTTHEQLKPISAQLLAIIGYADVQMILASELEPGDFIDS